MVSSTLSYVRMKPVFSATNTRPFGAIAMSCGLPTPGSTVVSAKPAGSVTAAAPEDRTKTKRQANDVANAKALTILGPLRAMGPSPESLEFCEGLRGPNANPKARVT